MKLSIYDQRYQNVHVVNAERVYIDSRLRTCVHRTPFDAVNGWAVADVVTGYRVCGKWPSKKEAIAAAKVRLAYLNDEQIHKAFAKALNETSDAGEFIAFVKKKRTRSS